MMQDEFENEQFKSLLADYTKPIDDDGFSARITDNLLMPKEQMLTMRKSWFVGSAALIGGFIAAPQILKIGQFIPKLPAFTLSAPNINADTLVALPQSYTLAGGGLLILMVFWLFSKTVFEGDL